MRETIKNEISILITMITRVISRVTMLFGARGHKKTRWSLHLVTIRVRRACWIANAFVLKHLLLRRPAPALDNNQVNYEFLLKDRRARAHLNIIYYSVHACIYKDEVRTALGRTTGSLHGYYTTSRPLYDAMKRRWEALTRVSTTCLKNFKHETTTKARMFKLRYKQLFYRTEKFGANV